MDAPTAPRPDYFSIRDDGAPRELFPGVSIVATPGDRLMLSLVTLDPGASVPEHAHPHEQMAMVVAGRAEFTVGGQSRTLGEGDVARIPGGVAHSVRAVEGPATIVDAFHPVRDDYR